MLKQVLFIIDQDSKKKSIIFVLFSFLLICFETISIAIFLPFSKLILSGEGFYYIEKFDYKVSFLSISFFLILIFLIKNFFSIFFQYWQMSYVSKIQKKLSYKLLKNYLLMPYIFYINSNSANLIKNCENETQQFSNFLKAALSLLVEILIFISIIFFLIFFNWKIVLVVTIFFGITVFIYYLNAKPYLKKWSKQRINYSREVLKHLIETFNSIKEIKVFNKVNLFSERHASNLTNAIHVSIKGNILNLLPKTIFEVFFALIISFVGLIIYFTKINVNEFLPIFIIFLMATLRLIPGLTRIMNYFQVIKLNQISVSLLYLELKKNYISDNKQKQFIDNLVLKNLNLKNICYSYNEKKRSIINNFNKNFVVGKIYGILGPSGAGKTTLINLISGLLLPQKGEVLINDIIDIHSMKNNIIAYLPQKPYLLDSSLKKNIALEFDEEKIDIKKIKNAIKIAELESFVEGLPNSYDEIVGENGKKISGGQLQRIALARSIYNDSKIIIFDEPTSDLDEKTEIKIFDQIKKIKDNKIIIIVSHSRIINEYIDVKIELTLK